MDKRKIIIYLTLAILIITAGYGALKLGLAYNEITVSSDNGQPFWEKVSAILSFSVPQMDPMPEEEKNRLDILVLGMRGLDDPDGDQGGLLTDTILLFSYDKETKKSSIISIPRDLYMKIDDNKVDKANVVYEYAISKRQAFAMTKRSFSSLTSVYIDNVIVFDFEAFKKIIDTLGGIDVYLDRPFDEANQWGYEFHLPAGDNHLDGETALYYARSRYSTSDFDRSRRQQQIIMALKDKIIASDLSSDPIKIIALLNSMKSDIKTDLNIWDAKTLFNLYQQLKIASPKEYVISTNNLLYQTYIDSIYVLMPKNESYSEMKKLFADILN